MNANTLFILNLCSTWYMVGLIWMVQVVHYAMFDRVGESEFIRYAADHNRLITPIVGVPMLIEIATACMLLAMAPDGFPRWAAWVGVAMIIAIWISTAVLQVPCHERLGSGFDVEVYRRLVNTNWIRTILWTARGVMMGYFLTKMLR
ncbi:hypothetical protein Poly51_32800 [Rubripirellula tenax]|uniref:DUF1772 domain-containing protein n=1 Tax=Rubripirellula tenax TaxID=2528015 RepID=A0A5C6F535_9BACT|nr:hypothetical protein [Rubripirellula tenax]TWU54561.1 hypothetical protein Poly51_32800 [Rubripirellula tenax]